MNAAPKQDVAVVAVGRNDGERLKGCLRSVVGKARVVVYVDSGSVDGSARYAASVGCDVVELNSTQGATAARARNEGFARVMRVAPDVSFVQFLDADSELADGWLKQGAVALTRSQDVGVVCGHVRETRPGATGYGRLCDLEGRQPTGEVRSAGNQFMVRTEVFGAAGGFRPELIAAEDEEFCMRVRALGEVVLKLDKEMARHDADTPHFGHWWQRSRRRGYGYGQVAALQERSQEGGLERGPERNRESEFVRICRFTWLWGLALPALALVLAPFTRGLSLAAMLLAYAAQCAAKYFQGRRRGWVAGDAWVYAFFAVVSHFPALLGLLSYEWRQIRPRSAIVVESKRKAEEKRLAEDRRREEARRQSEETRQAEEDRRAEDKRQAEEDRRAEEERRTEAMRREEERQAEERQAEDERRAERQIEFITHAAPNPHVEFRRQAEARSPIEFRRHGEPIRQIDFRRQTEYQGRVEYRAQAEPAGRIEDEREEELDSGMNQTAQAVRVAEAVSASAPEGNDRAGGTIRVALMGTGQVAEWHARGLRSMKNVQLAAVGDTVPGRAEVFARRFEVPQVYGSLDAMLSAEKLDAVHILVSPDLHFEAAQTALLAGVNVFLAQPMCTNAESCESLMELAAERGLRLAVGHNSLFAEPYERLRNDVCAGALGRIDDVTIAWHRALPQLMSGPFDGWMLRDPRNVLVEIGSHSVAHLLDLVGEPDEMQVQPENPVELPAGVRFYRRWQVTARKGPTAVELRFSFAPGFSEHTIHVRGSLAAATVDLERNTYALHRHRPQGPELDIYAMLAGEAASLKKQAQRSLWRTVRSKVQLRERGNPYGDSIAKAIEAFYAERDGSLDARVNGRLGAQAVLFSAMMGQVAMFPTGEFDRATAAKPISRRSTKRARILVLGGTGVLGRELVQQLSESGQRPRLLVHHEAALTRPVRECAMECVSGDLMNRDDLRRAMEGVECVLHLARARVSTWEDYQKFEIGATRQVAECALEAGVGRLIYTGTIESYYTGRGAGEISEKTPLDHGMRRRDFYARAKAASEELLMRMQREKGLPVVVLRPGMVVGRGASPFHPGVGMWWYDSICQMWGEGANKLPLVLVDDVAGALVAAAETPGIEGRSFNLVGGVGLTAREYLDELDRCGGMRVERHATPLWRFYLADWMKWAVKAAARDPERRWPSYREWNCRMQGATFDCAAARTTLGWAPEMDRAAFVRRGIEEPLAEWMR